MENNLILVSNWEKVDANDFYLSNKWAEREDKESVKKAKELQKEDNLYHAYIIDAKCYALFSQMDSDEVYIDRDGEIILKCGTAIIDNKHEFRTEYETQRSSN